MREPIGVVFVGTDPPSPAGKNYSHGVYTFAIQPRDGSGGLCIWRTGAMHEFIPIDSKIPGLTRKLKLAFDAAFHAGKEAKAEEIRKAMDL